MIAGDLEDGKIWQWTRSQIGAGLRIGGLGDRKDKVG